MACPWGGLMNASPDAVRVRLPAVDQGDYRPRRREAGRRTPERINEAYDLIAKRAQFCPQRGGRSSRDLRFRLGEWVQPCTPNCRDRLSQRTACFRSCPMSGGTAMTGRQGEGQHGHARARRPPSPAANSPARHLEETPGQMHGLRSQTDLHGRKAASAMPDWNMFR